MSRSQRPSVLLVGLWLAIVMEFGVGLGWVVASLGGVVGRGGEKKSRREAGEGKRERRERTIVTTAYTPSVNHGLPVEHLIIADGLQPLDPRLRRRLLLPDRELLRQPLDRVVRGCCRG